jgi:HD-GYP domain-containing protein (c-di-GMP phosphodiesterase class II)
MMASEVYETQKKIYISSILILLAGVCISLIFGMLFSRKITGPIEELVEGTRRVSKGDLKYKVPTKGQDEISELASSFNTMADALDTAQQKNRNYFYSVIQSLVRIVEAKDPYTRGHSERVSEYAAKIASRMGFTLEQLEMLKETAMIHDIGKLGIQDNILNKKEKLTDEEWEMIKRHPLIGEDIIKPVSLNQEILATVRGHHERFDGNGYPDSIKGDSIHIFAQILSVVDAYDAMVSSRAYRVAMSEECAIEELKKHTGAQFNPKIIDIFIQILSEEERES